MRRLRIRKINTYISNKARTACHKLFALIMAGVAVGVADHKPVMSARRSLVNWLTHITQPYSRVLYKYNTHTHTYKYIYRQQVGRSIQTEAGRQVPRRHGGNTSVGHFVCNMKSNRKCEIIITSLTGCPPPPSLSLLLLL